MTELEGFDRKALSSAQPAWSYASVARFQDVDAAGIVFFANILGYFHDAYLAFMAEGGLPHHGVLREGVWGAPIRHAEADFIAPIRFGDALSIGIVKAAFRESVLTIGYRVVVDDRQTVAAVGRTEHVIVAFPQMTRREPPEALKALFAKLGKD